MVSTNNSVRTDCPTWLLTHEMSSVLDALKFRYDQRNYECDQSILIIDLHSLVVVEKSRVDYTLEAKISINKGDISGYGDSISYATCYIVFPYLEDKAVLKDVNTGRVYSEVSLVPKRRSPM